MTWLAKLKIESRKLIVMLISVAAYLTNALTGKRIDEETMLTVLGLVGAWLLAQGIADHGQQGAAIAVRRAAKQGEAVAAAVTAALSRAPAAVPAGDPDAAQPQWADTSAMDVADQEAADREDSPSADRTVVDGPKPGLLVEDK
jgi:hypothetical protein